MKKCILILIILTLLVSVFPLNSFADSSSNELIKLNLKMNIDENVVKANKVMKNNEVLKKNLGIDILNVEDVKTLNNNDNNKLSMTLKLNDVDENGYISVEGDSVLKIEGKKYSILYEGSLKNENIDGNNLLVGTLWAKLDIDSKEVPSAMKIFINNKNEALINLSIGTLNSDDGVGFLTFGNYFKEQMKHVKESKERLNKSSTNNEDTNVSFTSAPSYPSFEWITSATHYYYDGYNQSGYASQPTVIMDMYKRDPNDIGGGAAGQELVRVFANTAAISEKYSSEPFYLGASTQTAEIQWGWTDKSQGNIFSYSPGSSSTGWLSTLFNLFAQIGDLNPIATILCDYFISSSPTTLSDTNADSHINWMTKRFLNVNNIDFPADGSFSNSNTEQGGVSAMIEYTTYNSNSYFRVYGEASILYEIHFVEWFNSYPVQSGTASSSHWVFTN